MHLVTLLHLSVSCEKDRLHINPEFGSCEIITQNGRVAQPGEMGEIVATSFCNKEQVFVRYATGDMAIVSSDQNCPCGRSMTVIEKILGRMDDILYVPERGFIGRLDPVFKALYGILEAQIIQSELDSIVIKLVPLPEYHDNIGEKLMLNLRKKVGDNVRISIDKVDFIPRGANGKFQSVRSLCKNLYPKL